MATANHSTGAKSADKRKTAGKTASTTDAVALLKADHREVEKLFGQFETAKANGRKKEIADKICRELRVHMQIEEEIFYPRSREVLKDEDIVDEAVVEHASARNLVEEIEGMEPGEDLYDAKVTVLKELIEHHVEEEEGEYFPKVRKTDMDLKAVGGELKDRKDELMKKLDGGSGRAAH